jgi:DNA-binding MarR family transcriptional regulator
MPLDVEYEILLKADALRRSTGALWRRLRAKRADHGIRASKLSVLGWLERAHRPLTASRLAELERLQPQSLTRIIAELDEGGLIKRREDESDRRQLLIEITAKGHDLLVEDARRQNRWLADTMQQKLTPAERDLLLLAARLLDQLTAEEMPPPVQELGTRDTPDAP